MLASADFNRDGYGDLAVSTTDYVGDQDRVYLIYGGRAGLSSNSTLIYKSSADKVEALVAADFDCDRRAELVVGRPNGFRVHHDPLARDTKITRYGIETDGDVTAQSGEFTEVSTAAADFTGDGYQDLAYALFYEFEGGHQTLYIGMYTGSAKGLRQRPAFADRTREPQALAAGDIDGDRRADLVVAGRDRRFDYRIWVHPGTDRGLDPPTATLDRSAFGVPGLDTANTSASVAVGDTNADGRGDLAVGG